MKSEFICDHVSQMPITSTSLSITEDNSQPSFTVWKGGCSVAESERYKDWAGTVIGPSTAFPTSLI